MPKPTPLDARERARLLQIARASIESASPEASPNLPDGESPRLSGPGACFVTLRCDGELRGCIGTVDATRPLAEAVSLMARRAAFEDPRFPPVEPAECRRLKIAVSVVGPLEPLGFFASASALARCLQPGVDGVLIEGDGYRATFLPEVWSELPDPDSFVARLADKARLPAGNWPDGLQAYRYGCESFSEA